MLVTMFFQWIAISVKAALLCIGMPQGSRLQASSDLEKMYFYTVGTWLKCSKGLKCIPFSAIICTVQKQNSSWNSSRAQHDIAMSLPAAVCICAAKCCSQSLARVSEKSQTDHVMYSFLPKKKKKNTLHNKRSWCSLTLCNFREML